MKGKFVLFLLALISFIFYSCQSNLADETFPDVPGEGELYTISLGMDGDDWNPTTRAAAKTIYGINVEYYRNGVRQGYYAYGLFDDLSNAKITLIGGYTYFFTCSIVRAAGDALWYGPYSSNSFSGYAKPFQLNNSVSTPCQNKFVEGTGNYLSGLDSGTAIVKNTSASSGYEEKTWPSLERYYGEKINFNPATDGTKVIIPVVKAYFGCKLIIKGVEHGELATKCTSNPDMKFLSASTRMSDYVGVAQIYSFPNVSECLQYHEKYSYKVRVQYDYDSFRGKDWDLTGVKEVTFKRNVLTTITVSVTPDLSGASVGSGYESMSEDNIIEFGLDENYNLYQKEN